MSDVRAPVIVIGIDAASPALLERWIADGTLPVLRSLVARGASARIGGVDGFFVGSTWPSLYTGTSPATHGVHYQVQLVPGSYALHDVTRAAFVRATPFWHALDDAGKRIAMLDVPLSRPALLAHGVQVVEWGGHDSMFGFQASPASLAEELRARYGVHPQAANCDATRRSAADYRVFLDRLEEGIRLKTAWTREMMARGPWDMIMQVFTEAHCTGHQCWHLHDSGHPAHDPVIAAELGDPLRRIYARLDAALGEILAAAGESRVVVFTAHGMSHWYGAQFLLPEVLVRLGVTQPVPAAEVPDEGVLRRAAGALWRRLPAAAKAPMRGVRRAMSGSGGASAPSPRIPADAPRSACFPLANGQAVGGIRLNLAGREPEGVLQPGAEAEVFCDRLVASLMAVIDERTGAPAFLRVVRTRDLYAGDRLHELPDLLVEWSDAVATGSTRLGDGNGARVTLRSPEIGEVSGENRYGRSGEHRPGGWLVASGPGIPAGRSLAEIPIYSVAPTLAAMTGVRLDGRVVAELE